MTRLALIGCGRWGQNILRTLQGMPSVRVTHVVASERPGVELGGAAWLETAATLPLHTLDGVLVATPGSTHAAVALPFIERGLPVFIEKPLATSVADAEQLAAAAAQSGASVMVGHIHHYNPAWQAVSRLLPELGRIRAIHFEGTNMGPWRDDMSVLWDWGPHAASLALALMGELPAEVRASGQRSLRPETGLYDTVWMTMRWAVGSVMTAHLSWLFPEKRMQLSLVGSECALVWNDRAKQKVTLFHSVSPAVSGGLVAARESSVERPAVADEPPLAAELAAFTQLVRDGTPVPTDIAEGVAVVRILAAAEQQLLALD